MANEFDFSEALTLLKNGKCVTRKAWGHNVFVYLVPAAAYPAATQAAKAYYGDSALVPYMAYLAIKRADDRVCIFVLGMDSVLADDWVLVSSNEAVGEFA